MKFFIDTEFMEDGETIELLSLGMVREDGETLYAQNTDADLSRANDWVKEHVVPQLDEPGPANRWIKGPPATIAGAVRLFVNGEKPEFWGYYADYDWVAFCQLFGPMVALPKGWPMYCRDVKQLCDELGNPKLPEQGKGEHHALLDALWNKQAYHFLQAVKLAKEYEPNASECLYRWRRFGQQIDEWKGREFPIGAIVNVNGNYGLASAEDGCPADKLPVRFENGNVWYKPIDTVTRVRDLKTVPPWVRRMKLRWAGIKCACNQ